MMTMMEWRAGMPRQNIQLDVKATIYNVPDDNNDITVAKTTVVAVYGL